MEKQQEKITFSSLTNFSPKQKEAELALDNYKYLLYGGALGGGKSYGLRGVMLKMLIRYYQQTGKKGIQVGLFCEDYPTLQDRQLSKLKFEFPEWLGTYSDKTHNYTVKSEYGGGVIAFRNLDEISKYKCFHPDTEILTSEGGKYVKDITTKDIVPSLNPTTKLIENHPVNKVGEYDFNGNLIETPKNKQFVAFSVTPNHNILHRNERNKTLRFTEAKDIPSSIWVPTNGKWTGKERKYFIIPEVDLSRKKKLVKFEMTNWLTFLGGYLSEGSLGSRERYEIRISQRKNKDKIIECVKKLGYKYYVSDDEVKIYGKSLFMYLKQFGRSADKFIPREIIDLSPRLLKYLFESLISGDGHRYSESNYRYVSISKQLINDISEVGLKIGLTPTIIDIKNLGTQYPNAKKCWQVGFRRCSETKILKKNLVETYYKGKVYCITTEPNHNVFIRYNKRVSISGQSAEFAMIGVDELTQNPEEIFTFLRTRLRGPGIANTKFVAATNPDGIGYLGVKTKWIDRIFPPNESEAELFHFVKALPTDNPFLDETYIKSLESLPEKKRNALLYGDGDSMEGQFFEEGSSRKHVVRAFDIPSSGRKFRSIDVSGRNGYTACTWFALDYDGNVGQYREYYRKGMDADEHARNIANLSKDEYYQYTVIDNSAFSKIGLPETLAEVYVKNGIDNLVPSSKERVQGGDFVHQYLRGDDFTEPKLRFFDNCKDTIRTLPSLIYDKNNSGDMDTDGEDHIADTIRYFIQTVRGGRTQKPMTAAQKRLKELYN